VQPKSVYEALLKLMPERQLGVAAPRSCCAAPPSQVGSYRCPPCHTLGLFHEEPGCGGFTCGTCGAATTGYISLDKPYLNHEDNKTREHWCFGLYPTGPFPREVAILQCAARLPSVPEEHIQSALRLVNGYAAVENLSSLLVYSIAALLLVYNPDLAETRTLRLPVAPPPRHTCISCSDMYYSARDARHCWTCKVMTPQRKWPRP